MLSVNPIEQTQTFKGIKPSLKKIMPVKSNNDAAANTANVISAVFWLTVSLGIIGSAVYSIVNAFNQNSKSDKVETVDSQKAVNSENTLDLSI